jgi:hypothetical protein
VLGLVHDEDRPHLRLDAEPGHLGANDAVGGGAAPLGGQAQLPGDGLVHVGHVAGGERHVEDSVEAGVERGRHLAADGGLAAPGLAGDEADATQVEEVAQAHLQLGRGGGGEQILRCEVLPEGVTGEAEVLAVHGQSSFFARSARRSPSGFSRFTKQFAWTSTTLASWTFSPFAHTWMARPGFAGS